MSHRRLAVIASLLALAGCATAVPPPAPPRVVPVPARPAPPVTTSTDWRDWPLTPGDWSYRRSGGGSSAVFGSSLALTCDPTARRVTLTLMQPQATVPHLTVRTSSAVTMLSTGLSGSGQPFALLEASDPLLDAMGFSRGRFVIEQSGRAPLVVPAWPEILRVAEDCRG